jgi:hypothetical protein
LAGDDAGLDGALDGGLWSSVVSERDCECECGGGVGVGHAIVGEGEEGRTARPSAPRPRWKERVSENGRLNTIVVVVGGAEEECANVKSAPDWMED